MLAVGQKYENSNMRVCVFHMLFYPQGGGGRGAKMEHPRMGAIVALSSGGEFRTTVVEHKKWKQATPFG